MNVQNPQYDEINVKNKTADILYILGFVFMKKCEHVQHVSIIELTGQYPCNQVELSRASWQVALCNLFHPLVLICTLLAGLSALFLVVKLEMLDFYE